MASSKISSVQILDSRIDPQPNPTYAVTIGPDQNQFYKIGASGLSPSSITFNNLTTLGKDRAYLDSFELELAVKVKFELNETLYGVGASGRNNLSGVSKIPPMGLFMPQSFPFNTICDQVQININGGAFFNNPSQIIRAKERYWNERILQESYGNVCPCAKPLLQNELGVHFQSKEGLTTGVYKNTRSRIFGEHGGYAHSSTGPFGTTNFSIIPPYDPQFYADGTTWDQRGDEGELTFTWREPIMCSPFSSRYDATYGRPLYNITSIDLSFKMLSDLRNMFICMAPDYIGNYSVEIISAQLCYQVLTVTAPVPHDITVIPYRRYVPYITNGSGVSLKTDANGHGDNYEFTSGVYTLNEVPTAIWIFAGPTLDFYQKFMPYNGRAGVLLSTTGSNVNNKLFGFLKHLSISCGNTTQILDTATIYDLYRIAKANGCQDTFEDWSVKAPCETYLNPAVRRITPGAGEPYDIIDWLPGTSPNQRKPLPGCGSVLRLIPGVDIVLPEQRLVPGANANNLVFQVKANYDFEFGGGDEVPVALWILFEYVGVATITPGNCMVSMNPLGNGSIMDSAPVIAASDLENVSTTEGSGWWDTLKNIFSKVNTAAHKTKLVSKLLNYVPKVGPMLSEAADKLGYGDDGMMDEIVQDAAAEPHPSIARKRARKSGGAIAGGAVLGLGDFC